jgi:pimeloyl-ACP methyl ester carboxylesterase
MASKNIEQALEQFRQHYQDRLGKSELKIEALEKNGEFCHVRNYKIKKGNYPRVFHHGRITQDVIVLTHGLSDSPYYMEAVGKYFFDNGINVILPLLPAHGLKNPEVPIHDEELDSKWRAEIDNACEVAGMMGRRISIGGFSTGGALGLNKILRDPETITGGLFLFSGAIDVRLVREASRFSFIQSITRMTDGVIIGYGRDPYKYPRFPYFGAIELGQIISENRSLISGKKIKTPVFAAHSVHDDSAMIQGIIMILEKHVEVGQAFIVSENVAHAELPLDADIKLNTRMQEGPETPPRANPQFDTMMFNCMAFMRRRVRQAAYDNEDSEEEQVELEKSTTSKD